MSIKHKNPYFAGNLAAKLILAALIIVFLFLAIYGLAQTSTIDPHLYKQEHILFQSDSFALNVIVVLLIIGLFTAAVVFFGKNISKRTVKLSKIILCGWVFTASIVWMVSVSSVPGADSQNVVTAANLASRNDFSFFSNEIQYFQMFPFQLGLVAIYEPIYRVFGNFAQPVMFVLNAVFLTAAELALVMIAERLFHEPRVTLLSAVLLGLCFQPILFTTFLYGNLLGFAAILWACYFLVLFLEKRNKLVILWITVLCTISIVAKSNNWIGVTAIVIVLLINLFERFHWENILVCILIVAVPFMTLRGIQSSYEHRANIALGSGTPQTAWLVMGFSESDKAPGWYNGYTYNILKDANWDTKTAKQMISNDLSARLSVMEKNADYTSRFFLKKLVSQWNEPTFQSIWISEVKEHRLPLPSFAQSIYDGRLGNVLASYFEHFVSLIYFTFVAGLLALLFQKRSNTNNGMDGANHALTQTNTMTRIMLIPLFILGGGLYHMLFEAKSQYILPYFVMIIPFSAYGLVCIADLFVFLTKKGLKRPK